MSMIKEYHPVRTLQSYIMPQNSFFTHLENERARADRNNKGFVLIVFDMTSVNGTTELFINSVKNRVRKTDVIGWFKEKKLGVLLYESSSHIGYSFADSLNKMMGPGDHFPPYELYEYPYAENLKED